MDVDTLGEMFPAVVSINVGGVLFAASLETLRSGRFGVGGSMIAAMFSGRIPSARDVEGRVFIDRDGRHFHHILNYLRDGCFPAALTAAERVELEREASFYGLDLLAAHLRADLQVRAKSASPEPSPRCRHGRTTSSGSNCQYMGAAEAAKLVSNHCLEEWPDFPMYVQSVIDRLLLAAGLDVHRSDEFALSTNDPDLSDASPVSFAAAGAIAFDEVTVAALSTESLAAVQVELAHVDPHSQTWRWSDRKIGVNSVLRAKLLKGQLQRLGYIANIQPVFDKKTISAIVLQVELPNLT